MSVHAEGRAELVPTPIARAEVGVDLIRGAAAAFYFRNQSSSTSGGRAVVSSSRRPARRSGPTPRVA